MLHGRITLNKKPSCR